jgi:aminoglycoside phosphotransferase (APT) family kinase protein
MEELIAKLFDESYVREMFKKRVLPHYPDFANIKKVKIFPIKNNVWKNSYHIVLKFEVYFQDRKEKTQKILIFCSAHSHEPRRNVYSVLKFLWRNNFSQGYLTVPKPLFYSNYFKAVFYRGVKGENLYYYIKNRDFQTAEKVTAKAAAWLVKLHKLPTSEAINFNKKNSRVKTVIPGEDHILNTIRYFYPEYHDLYAKAYRYIREKEKEFFNSGSARWLIHGDAHPENVIKISEKKVAFIDYADFCLSDFARDIGSFIQQLDFMTGVKASSPEKAEELKKIFLNNYQELSKVEWDKGLLERIDMYYYWTALRTITHYLLRHNPSREKAEPLIKEVEKYLDSRGDF